MAKKNFTISTVATAPSPATTGTSLVVAAGDGSLFAVNEPAIVFPVNDQPLVANAEIVMVTDVTTDTLTITRGQESTTARTIVIGDIIIQGITAKDWNDLLALVAGKITAFADPNADRIVFWDDSVGAFAALTASTGLTLSGTNLTVRAATTSLTGIVELATDTEFTTGTDATRFINAKQAASVAQTMTNKTLTSPVIDTGVSGTAVLDEDNMASDSATKLATQQSIKAYVDGQNTVAQTLTNKIVQLTSTPSDLAVSGITVVLTASSDVDFGDVCYINSSGKATRIDADAIASMSGIVMATDLIDQDTDGVFLLQGFARNDAWTWTVGGLIYGSTVGSLGNTLTQTAPSGTDDVVQIMGVATHADRMLFNPQLVQIERT